MKILILLLILISLKNPLNKIKIFKKVFNNLRKNLNNKNKILLEFLEISCNTFNENIASQNLNIIKRIAFDLRVKDLMYSLKIFRKLFNYKCRNLFNKTKSKMRLKNNSYSKVLSYCPNEKKTKQLNIFNDYVHNNNNEKEFCFNTLYFNHKDYFIKAQNYKVTLDDKLDRIIIKDIKDLFLCQVNEVSDWKNERLHHKLILIYYDKNNYINCHQVKHYNLINKKVNGQIIWISINLEEIFKA